MPINLDDLTKSTMTVQYKPNFFDKSLTGNGKRQGVLCESINPVNLKSPQKTGDDLLNHRYERTVNAGTETTYMPFSPITAEAWNVLDTIPTPDLTDAQLIGDTHAGAQAYLEIIPHLAALDVYHDDGKVSGRKFSICYRIMCYTIVNPKDTNLSYSATIYGSNQTNCYTRIFSCDVKAAIDKITQMLASAAYSVDYDSIDAYLGNYNAFDAICERSKAWQTCIEEDIRPLVLKLSGLKIDRLWPLQQTISRLEQYNVPLESYVKIYDMLEKHFDKITLAELAKENLNLLLHDTMYSLEQSKPQLEFVPKANVTLDPKFSIEQVAAITADEPLVLVQSGAGTGKAQPYDEPVLTPNGYVLMGDLKVGDEVIGSDGKPTRVKKIHERGMLPGYKLTFTDGSSTRVCGEHLWTICNDRFTDENNKPQTKTVTTDEWLKDTKLVNNWYIPTMNAFVGKQIDGLEDPYMLGLVLAKKNNRIPPVYFRTSITQRTQLVNGLFDTAGTTVKKTGATSFKTKYERLARDVQQLLWSLGVKATIGTNTRDGKTTYIVRIKSNYDPYKTSKYAGMTRPQAMKFNRKIAKAKSFDAVRMRCIEVEASDNLYVTNDYIVTHNSTTILERIKYMQAAGVDPDDITVLSFTNAAADHISELNPDVHSMTIAKMVHTIYIENYPKHQLASMPTLINSLDIYFPRDIIADDFKAHLRNCRDLNKGSFTNLNNFIENHFDQVIAYLDAMAMTTLELEIIICYQKIHQMKEPPQVACRHLIIDEVQDNSIFEFVYVLKYVEKNKQSLYIVGDCSQTLYEFRASNPRALNVMEASGVFATYKLQINYRSNQDILDFANVALANIEANQYAKIRLRANNLSQVTADTFRDRITCVPHRLSKLREIDQILPNIFRQELVEYIKDCFDKGENVAFLSYERKHAETILKEAEAAFPNKMCISLVPTRPYDSTVFSMFIKRYWDEVRFAMNQPLTGVIHSEIISHLDMLTRSATKALPSIQDMLQKWSSENRQTILGWQQQVAAGTMTAQECLDRLKQNMLDYEIQHNAVKQALISSQNAERKQNEDLAKADFIVSTIHSAKGLEFDNTIVLYKATPRMEEDVKRMYYVALTRAMQTEYICEYDSIGKSDIMDSYERILEQLDGDAMSISLS